MLHALLIVVTVLLNCNRVKPQDTSNCGKTVGCFTEPKGCTNTNCQYLFKWKDSNDITEFEITSKIEDGKSIDSVWLGIGFSEDRQMGNDNAVICKNVAQGNRTSIAQYYNKDKNTPTYLDDNNRTIGLDNILVESSNGFLKCSFTRVKYNNVEPNYFDLRKTHFIIAAYGPIQSGLIGYHDDSKTSSATLVNFESNRIYSNVADKPIKPIKIQIHGCLMIVAWIFFASTGIVVARYYKNLLPTQKICGLQYWFVIHRPYMIMATLISIASFIIILNELKWKWIPQISKTSFIHSILGIITIVLAIIQPIMAAFRPDKNSQRRYLFNYVHRGFGFVAFSLSIATMILASYIRKLNLGNDFLILLIAWTCWILLYFCVMELLSFLNTRIEYKNLEASIDNDDKSMNNNVDKFSFLKNILLILHLIISTGISIALIVILFKISDII